MQFDSFQDFLNMGGYAIYVWVSYGITFGSLAILIYASATKENKVLKNITLKHNREQRIKASRRAKNEPET
ncbi:heme exporter protein CcmD [Parashewanella spongiae]|uniref:Heme exporter protein D n=1 Tax=Parashewanella spongiae TaxID=342950 RepID=A0A3A6TN60_9GAMM|nr:heme exporter protein CcmD [Parashewanella spongiae]MCL1079920.1 heme exporter protein CcmD [Parashewanella spongiae]RJY06427.1 heme exporter protein CcmD [Parashewanella spongiae]